MEVFDFLSDEHGDLLIKDGNFVVGESTGQHIRNLLLANKGEYKQFPTIGVGINSFLLDDLDDRELSRMITTEFENDGMIINRLSVRSLEDLEIEAEYADNGS